MTKGDFEILDDKLNTMRKDQKEMAEKINYLDSLIRADTEESIALKAELRSSVTDLIQQFQTTQANMYDLQDKLDQLLRNPEMIALIPATPGETGEGGDSTAASDSTTAMPAIDCQKVYDDAFVNIVGGQYEEAIEGFNSYLEYCENHGQADNARFWIGEAYYSMEKFHEAISEFDLLITDYPNSVKRASALYKIARSYEELGQKNDAIDNFQKVVDDFPDTFEASQAADKLKELKES
jgi:tol-pal system protein YbgF